MDVQMWNKSMLKNQPKFTRYWVFVLFLAKMRIEPSKEEFQDE